jgi:hypothetical protein
MCRIELIEQTLIHQCISKTYVREYFPDCFLKTSLYHEFCLEVMRGGKLPNGLFMEAVLYQR